MGWVFSQIKVLGGYNLDSPYPCFYWKRRFPTHGLYYIATTLFCENQEEYPRTLIFYFLVGCHCFDSLGLIFLRL